MKKEESVFEKIGLILVALPFAVVLILAIGLPLMLLRAFVFRYLWLWFIVPLFSMTPIGYGQAMGISLIVGFFMSANPLKKEYKESDWKIFGTGISHMAVALFLGYLVHRFGM